MAKDGYYRSNNTRIKPKPFYLTAEKAEMMYQIFGKKCMSFVPGYLDPEAEAEKEAAIAKKNAKEIKDLKKSIKALTKKEEAGTLNETEKEQLDLNRDRLDELS